MARTIYPSPVGELILIADEIGITYIGFLDADDSDDDGSAHLELAKDWLDIYFSGKNPGFSLPLHIQGTSFQREVWDELALIPYGETRTYGEIAAKIAQRHKILRMSPQAVGQAAHRNPIALYVPCHRLVASRGKLGGYAGGVSHKAFLLNLEGASFHQ